MVRRTRETCRHRKDQRKIRQLLSLRLVGLKKFIPDQNFKIKDITPSLFLNYYTFRKKQTKDKVQNVTLINEKATINTIFKFGIRNGYVSPIFVPEFPRIQKECKS